jgi:hypothetical protein
MSKKYLQKEAIGLTGGMLYAAKKVLPHVAQNTAIDRLLLNEKGGMRVADAIKQRIVTNADPKLSNHTKSFVDGLKHSIAPEIGAVKDEYGNIFKKLPNLSRKEQIALHYIGLGQLSKVLNSKILERSKALKTILKEYNLDVDLLKQMKAINPKKYNEAISKLEDFYKNSKIGQFNVGLTKGVKDISPKKIHDALFKMPASEAAGEAVGNIAAGIVEPAIPITNGIKRFLADEAAPGSLKEKIQNVMNKYFVDDEIERAKKLALEGKEYPKWEFYGKKYLFNPVVQETAGLANKAGLLLNKYKNQI